MKQTRGVAIKAACMVLCCFIFGALTAEASVPNGEYEVEEENGVYTVIYPDFTMTIEPPESLYVYHKNTDPNSPEAKFLNETPEEFVEERDKSFGSSGLFCFSFWRKNADRKFYFSIATIGKYGGDQVYIGSLSKRPDYENMLRRLRNNPEEILDSQTFYYHPQTPFLSTEYHENDEDARWNWLSLQTIYNNRFIRFSVMSKDTLITDEERELLYQLVDSATFTVPETNRFEYPESGIAFEVPWEVGGYGTDAVLTPAQSEFLQETDAIYHGEIGGYLLNGGGQMWVTVDKAGAAENSLVQHFFKSELALYLSGPVEQGVYEHPQGEMTERVYDDIEYADMNCELMVREIEANGKRYGFIVMEEGELSQETMEVYNAIIASAEFYPPEGEEASRSWLWIVGVIVALGAVAVWSQMRAKKGTGTVNAAAEPEKAAGSAAAAEGSDTPPPADLPPQE